MTALPPTYCLHVWWARRPLVASRAAVLASLLPADADRTRFLHVGPREFEYRMPGRARPVRVTTDPDYFDEHPGSLELWSPSSPVFPAPDEVASAEEVAATGGRLAPLLGGA